MTFTIIHSITQKAIRMACIAIALCFAFMPQIIAAEQAGSTIDKATAISDTTTLSIQDGDNYIQLPAIHLPATICYLLDSAFSPIPTAITANGDTLAHTMVFNNCQMQWQWQIEAGGNMQVINIASHENAQLRVEPFVCKPSYSDTTAVVCNGIQWGGAWRDEAGEYTITIPKADGCDSIRTLHLSFFTPVNTDTTASAWDNFSWYGNTYTQSGDYTIEKIYANGCDYIHTLHLTILTTKESYTHENACNSYTLPSGEVVTTSGEWLIDTTYTAEGRTINYLVVTMGETYYGEATLTACHQYESMSGTTYTESGVYQDTTLQYDGCLAIITLHLTIEDCNNNEAVDNINTPPAATKIIEDGQLYIIRKEETYTILGTKKH